jgi:hypothetical protein
VSKTLNIPAKLIEDVFSSRSGSSVRLDRSQHEELLLNLDPGLLMQAAQRQSSNGLNNILSNNNNNFNNNQSFNNYSNNQSFNNNSSNGFGSNNDDDYESSVESYYSPSASGGHLSPTSAHDQSPARKGLFWSRMFLSVLRQYPLYNRDPVIFDNLKSQSYPLITFLCLPAS